MVMDTASSFKVDFLKIVQLSNLPLTDSPGHAALTLQSTCARCVRQSLCPKITNNVYITGVTIDGNNHEVKERHIQLVKKRGKVKALDEELYRKWKTSEEEERVQQKPLYRIVFQKQGRLKVFTCPSSDKQNER
ncbi:hypothetical protein P7K49_003528 [Saguinus oedipus]|uniref:Uncharacterized protein n=1 Tax=Saguinus oedipus TaxID=9490 RepID=A0ABQ9W4S8_SAGOE|nr:hypothetical protein P7K49_003528 [Saguinus oedipus]